MLHTPVTSAPSALAICTAKVPTPPAAELTMIAVGDGSCFDPIQVVAPSSLSNYQDEVLHLSAGCAVRVTGELAASKIDVPAGTRTGSQSPCEKSVSGTSMPSPRRLSCRSR